MFSVPPARKRKREAFGIPAGMSQYSDRRASGFTRVFWEHGDDHPAGDPIRVHRLVFKCKTYDYDFAKAISGSVAVWQCGSVAVLQGSFWRCELRKPERLQASSVPSGSRPLLITLDSYMFNSPPATLWFYGAALRSLWTCCLFTNSSLAFPSCRTSSRSTAAAALPLWPSRTSRRDIPGVDLCPPLVPCPT